jgi:predicted RNA methylase
VDDQRDLFADAGSQPASPSPAEPASRPASRGRKVEAPAPRSTRISPRVLAALRGAVVGHDHVDLGVQQLPREVYLEAAAVLEIVGAKWHTGRKRHLFTQTWDPDMFADVLATGEAPPANPLSYFATPRPVSADLLNTAELRNAIRRVRPVRVLEPSAGTGALALAVAEFWADWARGQPPEATLELGLIEVDPRRCRILRATLAPKIEALLPGRITVVVLEGNFLEMTGGQVDAVLMNPPFSLPGDRCAWWSHLRHAFRFLHPHRGVVGCIAPTAWRYQKGPEMLAAIEAISTGTAWDFPRGAFSESGTGIVTCGIVLTAPAVIHEAGRCDTHAADAVIDSDLERHKVIDPAARRAAATGGPNHEDPRAPWRQMIFELTLGVGRGGDPVSFAEVYQRELSRIVWDAAVERLNLEVKP